MSGLHFYVFTAVSPGLMDSALFLFLYDRVKRVFRHSREREEQLTIIVIELLLEDLITLSQIPWKVWTIIDLDLAIDTEQANNASSLSDS
ncbi:hypothetical protein J6590_020360 [Homalodisca vitripennis]|nr:hypothetical protein J6590_020360 [Homalodisca vitripennis]